VVCLGKIAFDGFLTHQSRAGRISSRAGYNFAHGAEYALPGGIILLASYHPSLQNTNTGKLTRRMLLDVFQRARELSALTLLDGCNDIGDVADRKEES
jgi:uracil-DNA glycosylase